MSLARRLRSSICDTFLEVGALAPTLCRGWLAQDLAAHLWLREHRPDALPGIALPRFSGRTAAVQAAGLHAVGFEGLVAALRRPAGLGRLAPLNTVEHLIHHVDLSRANGLEVPLTEADERALWPAAAALARRAAGRFGGRLEVTTPLGHRLALGTGDRPVHVAGRPSELLCLFSGRVHDARVDVTAEPEQRQRFLERIPKL